MPIACMHEKYYYIDLVEAKTEKVKKYINSILETNFYIYNEKEGYIECKYCRRNIKNDPGQMHDKVFQNDKLVSSDAIKTEQEKNLMIIADDFLNFSSRFDFKKEDIVSSAIGSIILCPPTLFPIRLPPIKQTSEAPIKVSISPIVSAR